MVICGCFYVSLCQVLGQHWSATQAHSASPATRACSCPHLKLSDCFPPPMAASASADEAACTRQPRLRPGCHLHTVSSLDVVVAHCIRTDSPLGCVWPCPPTRQLDASLDGQLDGKTGSKDGSVCSRSIDITPLQDDPVLAADRQRKQ